MKHQFTAVLEIIGINPFVFIPEEILKQLFLEYGKDKGQIPVCGEINKKAYTQTLVKYQGEWRLYINTTMLKNSPKRIREEISIEIKVDTTDRTLTPPPKLVKALDENPTAKAIFEQLSPSKQKEIIKYISFLKSEKSIAENIEKTIGFLLGKNRFIGRDRP
ncbi:YdeI/OmpD-associated family protein [Pedobacter xixiisoli]|uniref:Bacteriocin-protection, YdeI or OmpD-Associated n=1 Tax=Pedobacter xixiisoli TaxID=1476464 RepID=A0A285ZNP7_9SPHI|nr:YdeI/OmpD-associated family protein [Pedobacter xixiisoli]SOD11278.1 protein of unknown function [Pedobacter xixiisoli]